MSKRRVVVTGLGMLSPLGLSVEETWGAIKLGKSGAAAITSFDVSGYTTQFAASVKNFNPEPFLTSKDTRRMDLFIQYGLVAAAEAINDAGLQITEQNTHRIGVAVGSGIGGMPMIEKNHSALLDGGPRKISPFFVPGAIINMVAGQLSIHYGMKGPNISVVTACTTGSHNIGFAARCISHGDADVMLAGGAEMATCPMGLGGFIACRALSTRNSDPERACRPWDKDRDGFVLGDGAGILVLEEYEHAKKRGAHIYAELAGFGMSADAYHMTAPDPQGSGGMYAIQNALQDAGLRPEDIQYVNAHATSTPMGDEIEALSIKRAFGDHAYKLAVSSTKSMTGHLLGAAGAVEAIFTILALRDQIAPPTINLEQPSEGCDLDFVPNTARQMRIVHAISNSFGFGGTNGSLLFSQI